MTAQEKAKGLVGKFYPFLNDYSTYSKPNEKLQIVVEDGQKIGRAKQCALIAVNEIVNELIPSDFKYQQLYTDIKTYWEQVKEEIKKL